MRSEHKGERMASLLQQLAAEFISREANPSSLITITRVILSNDRKNATIFFTVYPETEESPVMEFVERKTRDLRDYIQQHARIGHTPNLIWSIDRGEKNRQRLDDISTK